ncbi:MAG: putative nucleotidyltransferase [Rhodothermales bacterium]|jgi:predicted nucleotidyltransferase
MNLAPDFKEFVASLHASKVRLLIVGGYAVAFHGHPRYTKDLDVWIEISAENAARVVNALIDFGFAQLGLGAEDFMTPKRVIQLGRPPLRIDLVTSIDGVDFADCFETKETLLLDGLEVPFIGLEALRKNKRATGRSQDVADLDHLS